MSQSHQDHSDSNHDHGHNHAAHDAHADHAHDHDHDHVAVDPGEIIAEKSPQDQMLIGACVIAMTLLMICMGTWMQIPTPTGGGHSEHGEHHESSEHAPAQAPHAPETGAHSTPESHETQSH